MAIVKEELITMKKQNIFQKLESRLLIRCLGCTFLIIFVLILIFDFWKQAEFKRLLDIEYNLVTEEHTNISTLLYSKVYLESSNADLNMRSFEVVKNVMNKTVSYNNIEKVALFYNSKLIAGTYQNADNMDNLLLQKHYNNKCYLEEYQSKNCHYIKAISSVTLFDDTYILITTTDISDLYNLKNDLTYKITVFCIICACIIVFPFFFTIKNFLKHSNTNNTLL